MGGAVEPRVYKGLRDYLPDQMAARQRLIDTIRGVYERYGFSPLGTPAIEYLDVLTGSAGEEAQSSIFTVKGPGPEALGLRFDLTVPLARVVSRHRELARPFRRYQVAPVWRADKPDKGRFREFVQFDIDSVGVENDLADLEILAAICDTFEALDSGPYQVRYSSRRILGLLLEYAGVPAMLSVQVKRNAGSANEFTETVERPAADVFRVLDKLEKIGREKVRLELTTGYRDESGDFIPGLGLAGSEVDRIDEFLAIKSAERREVLSRLRELFKGLASAGAEIDVLERISNRLHALGYGDDRVAVDLSIARGLAYYTGPVFETVLLDAPHYGSVCSGGRYDDLVTRFLGERVPAVGASIGVDRLLAALVELGRIRLRPSMAQVLVTTMDPALTDDYLGMAFELRRAGIRTELYLGTAGFGKQVKHGDRLGVPLVIVQGSDEKARGAVTIKEMEQGRELSKRTGERAEWLRARPGQVEVPRAHLVEAVRKLLADLGA